MKLILKLSVSIILTSMLFYISCQKEFSCENCRGSNKPPIAHAGKDTTITLPANTVMLDGSASTDPDNNIVSYAWTKISGPSSFNIVNVNAVQTQVSNLTEGTYQFELKVTDAGGLFSKDTVQVTVKSQDTACDNSNRPIINIPLVPFATIPVPRTMITVATVGNKLLLAGGWLQPGSNSSSRVDIYDFSTQSWSSTNISVPRAEMATATLGNKVFFAGGEVPGFWGTSRVDIYDASTNTWSEAQLSDPRGVLSIAVLGQKIFFTDDDNGQMSTAGKVDIYDDATKAWSVITLRTARVFSTATAVGNKVYFAGGYNLASAVSSTITADIDIYDDATHNWSFSSLSQPTASMSSIFIDGKIYWAGGVVGYDAVNDRDISTCRVEIRDVNTQSSSFTNLSQPTSFLSNEQSQKPIFYKGKILFGGVSDIYDPLNNSWSIGKLPQNVSVESVVLINNGLYAIGHVIEAPPMVTYPTKFGSYSIDQII